MWRLSVEWWYCKEVFRIRGDGKTRELFNSMEEFSDFMKAVEVRNGGKFPIVDNFWFSFIGRIAIWGFIIIAVAKLVGFVSYIFAR
jgi:hypothetical protein